ncbi:unnamed protein product [Paramecium sonneborni]|uniref:Protein kinase domain-containing protein n=1 Tax=Paramecium sonneborni TaxID=65129 RepID=A0A8S1PQR1_9CILI|nr:unnamed protein product [Paramecium sonneborni]
MFNKFLKQVRQYQLKQIIGQGSFATVYLGVNEENQQCAVKEIKLDFMDESEESQKLMKYFDQEIEIYQKTKHNNLVCMIEEFTEGDSRYCIFEYCSKGDLNNFTKRNILNEEEAKIIFTQILAGMKYLFEKGIVHRDLKLDNILIDEENIIKIADFGFAKFYQQNDIFSSYCGTPATMAPEILNQQQYDFKCDIWSLGVILYYMIFKKYHWRGNVRSLIDLQRQYLNFTVRFDSSIQLSKDGEDIISRMLTSDKEKRINYEELFTHPWLEGKLDQKQNLLESQCFIQKKLNTISQGQRIGNIVIQQRKLKGKFCTILDQFIKDCKNEVIKQKFFDFKKQINSQKFNITIKSNDFIDQPDFKLFCYRYELYEILQYLYLQFKLDFVETAQKELELIQFIEKNPLSNGLTFTFEELNSREQIDNIRKSIIEEELDNFEEDDTNWSIDIRETKETKLKLIQFICEDRVSLSKLSQLQKTHVSKSNNILNKN